MDNSKERNINTKHIHTENIQRTTQTKRMEQEFTFIASSAKGMDSIY